MRKFRFKVIILLALAPLSSGCTSLFGTSSSASLPELRFPTADHSPAMRAAAAIEEGRAQLAAGNPGLAIEAFRHALASGEMVGPAANGIAVAYARIGRVDLARRYFNQAIATSPDSPTYLANLERLESSIGRTVATLAVEQSAKDVLWQDRELVAAARSQVRTVERPDIHKGIVRISRSEVKITTVPLSGKPSAARGEYLERNFQPAVRISLARDNRTTASTRPVIRITLPEAIPVGLPRRVAAGSPRAPAIG